jgi:hypothetical protein
LVVWFEPITPNFAPRDEYRWALEQGIWVTLDNDDNTSNDDSVVHFDCRPSENGNFLLRDFDVAVAGDSVIKGTQRIGWDPVSGKFRTWTFDSEGGYFDGYLSRDGDPVVRAATARATTRRQYRSWPADRMSLSRSYRPARPSNMAATSPGRLSSWARVIPPSLARPAR